MAWSEVLLDDQFSVGFATQANVNTAGSSWTFIDCEMPQVSYDAAQTDTKRTMRARGASTKILTGKVWPKIAIRFPVVGQLSAYAYASDTPGLKGANGLLDCLGGTAAIAYQAGGMSPTDGNTVSLITSQGKYGCLIAGRETSGVVNAMGFAKTIGAGGPYATDLFEDLKAQPGTTIGRLATYNFFPSTTQPSALTLRMCGASTAKEKQFLGCYLTGAKFSFDADWRLYCTVEFTSYGGELPKAELSGSGGGIQTIAECLALEPLVSRGGARFVVGSNVITTLADGTIDADGSCDVRDIEFGWEIDHYVALKPTGRQGVSEVITKSPVFTAAFSVPEISDYEVTAGQFAEEAWRNITEYSFSGYIGDTPGQLFAVNLPRLMPTAFPEPVMVEGALHRRVSGRAVYYSGDTASTDAGNKPARFGLG